MEQTNETSKKPGFYDLEVLNNDSWLINLDTDKWPGVPKLPFRARHFFRYLGDQDYNTNEHWVSPIDGLQNEEPSEDDFKQADSNMEPMFRLIDTDPSSVVILDPQKPVKNEQGEIVLKLQKIYADDYLDDTNSTTANRAGRQADFIYTFNPDTSIAVRTADCDAVFCWGVTEDGRQLLALTHISRDGANADYVKDMLDYLDGLGIKDKSRLRIQILGGIGPDNYTPIMPKDKMDKFLLRKNRDLLFTDVHDEPDMPGFVRYSADVSGFVYNELLSLGIDPYQIFVDTSDVGRKDSLSASHSRAEQSGGIEKIGRGFEIGKMDGADQLAS